MMQRLDWLTRLFGGVFLMSAAAVTSASAEDYPPCDTFVLTGGVFEYVTVDLGVEGSSAGDERLGERELLDGEGNVVGMLRWVSRVVDVEEGRVDDDVALNQLVYTLPGGTLHASGQLHYENILAEDTQPSDAISIAVVGGTRDYVRSQGEIGATFQDDGTSTFTFRLYCD